MDNNVKRNRRIAMDFMSRLVEEAIEEGRVPQPSSFGVIGEDDMEADPVYDWCQELIESIDEVFFPEEKH